MAQVVALERGHDGLRIREAGEEFDIDLKDPRYAKSTWFAPVDKRPAAKVEPANATPPGAGPKKGSAVEPGEDLA